MFSMSLTTLKKSKIDKAKFCVCVHVCVSVCVVITSNSSETVEVITVKLGTGDCLRHENESRVNYIDLDLHSRLHRSLIMLFPQGYFVPPAVITDIADSASAMQEEIFGPVTCVVPFDSEEEVRFDISCWHVGVVEAGG